MALKLNLLIILIAALRTGQCNQCNCIVGGYGKNDVQVPGGFREGMTFYLTGRPNYNNRENVSKRGFNFYRFDRSNLGYKETGLTWVTRMGLKLIITECYKSGWVGIKHNYNNFPFTVGKDFTIEVRIEKDRFLFYINGRYHDEYGRLVGPLESYNAIQLFTTDTEIFKSWCLK